MIVQIFLYTEHLQHANGLYDISALHILFWIVSSRSSAILNRIRIV
jgi:hypothetical protein